MTSVKVESGLVIRYSYLWARDHGSGIEEGRKDRPCLIAAVRPALRGAIVATVFPVTHSPPVDRDAAVEIPPPIKAHLGLDAHRSWIVVVETNSFLWPGPDLRPVPGVRPVRFHYGVLPPRFFRHVVATYAKALAARRVEAVTRTP